MSVKIRLRRMGAKKRPFYRLIVADSRVARDGRFIETLGYYNPCVQPSDIKIDGDRARYWLGVGAQPSDTAAGLLKSQGILDRLPNAKTATPAAPAESAALAESAAPAVAEAE